MSEIETTVADLWATGITTTAHPMTHVRAHLAEAGILSAAQLREAEAGTRVRIAGVVTHRQRPATASGVTFVNLEDETGMANVVVRSTVWSKYRKVARDSSALIVRGKVERAGTAAPRGPDQGHRPRKACTLSIDTGRSLQRVLVSLPGASDPVRSSG